MRAVLGAGTLLLALAVHAQQGAPPPVFGTSLELVRIVVTVEDAQGGFVGDLRAEDFVVREDNRPQVLRVFARAADAGEDARLALDVGLLLDVSGSMIEDVKLSREAAAGFLDAVPRARDLFVAMFDNEIQVARYRPEDRERILRWIAGTSTVGGTALYEAIRTAVVRLGRSPTRQVIVLLSDGEDYRSRISFDEIVRLVRASNATIYPLAFSGGFQLGSTRHLSALSFLNKIADLTGGRVFRPTTSADIGGIYGRILAELSSQYVLGYESASPRSDGAFRRIRVQVKGKGLKTRHREGYYSPAP